MIYATFIFQSNDAEQRIIFKTLDEIKNYLLHHDGAKLLAYIII